ncbi:phosphonate C-P lyase system protein PhnG [Salipiger aestuarii]|uniref:phosphonate C-P lyase system protein PhnG n=1 Tax=Salipiger aestuarii TaxID=568098 RepID=UPI00123BF6B1|nr:phosphonate C-P lyase system protein PhnG [Salipiger aestuarii]KAA8605640.1 phosphonate C-P lyase system protein PhnG [Salipiger aestuarii]
MAGADQDRAEWLGLLARADAAHLAGLWSRHGVTHTHRLLAGPETGMIRLTTTAGTTRFQFGEATCTRCVVELNGLRGYAVQLGSDLAKAEASACLDALLQSAPGLRAEILDPIRATLATERAEREQIVAATAVRFYTTRTSRDKCASR